MVEKPTTDDGLLKFIAQSSQDIRREVSVFERALHWRLVFWAIRWIIGFGIVGAVTHFSGQYDWLWIVGGGFASLSLAFLLFTNFRMKSKVSKALDDLDELETLDFDNPDA